METRPLGRSDLRIAPLMLGGNVFGWNVDESTTFALLDAFVDAGFNAIDTADSYSRWVPGHRGGKSEIVIGNWLKRSGKRDKVVIATKVGNDMGEGKNVTKDYILRAAEACLKRLQVDTIDLLQTHFDNEATPVEEKLAAYAQLIAQGKVRAIGASNLSLERLKASLAASKRLGIPRYESLQPNYNLYDRVDFEQQYAPFCAREAARRHHLLFARRRLPHRQIPLRGGSGQKSRARRQGKGLFRCAWPRHPQGARRGRRRPQRHAGADCACLADRPARRHRADRQCDQPRPAR